MSKPTMRIAIMAGGTGGHVFPALAVAKKLQERGAVVEWLGTARGIEYELVPKADIPLHLLTIEGVRGKGLFSLLKAPFLLTKAVLQARHFLKAMQADLVLGFGGFASGPGGVAAWTLGKPVVIHEQNAIAGTTNKLLSKFASKILTAFPDSLPRSVHVGNPVRDEIASVSPISIDATRPLHVLVLGGSLGAQALNELVPQAIAQLPKEKRPIVQHQTGKKHLEATVQHYQDAGVEAEVLSFIDDMAAAYEWADLVICRSGALTVSELALAGRGALLVPFPFAIDDHQTRNAEWLEKSGAAVIRQQKNLDPQAIAEFLSAWISDSEALKQMGKAARQLAKPQAAQDVAELCEQMVSG